MSLASPDIRGDFATIHFLLNTVKNGGKKNLTNLRSLRTSATHLGGTHKIRDSFLWSSLLWQSLPSDELCLDLDTRFFASHLPLQSFLLSSANRLLKITLWKELECFWAMQKINQATNALKFNEPTVLLEYLLSGCSIRYSDCCIKVFQFFVCGCVCKISNGNNFTYKMDFSFTLWSYLVI